MCCDLYVLCVVIFMLLVMKKLGDETARLIASGQVATSVANCVKELVENSLDADATNIEIKLDKYGLNKIEVRDNGRGIPCSDMCYAAQQHYTSKIKTHDDLLVVATYGFRGEALSSMCKVADVAITTRTKDELYSTVYTLDSNGIVKSQKPSHIAQGSTVVVSNLFKNLPVRRQYFSSIKKQKEQVKLTEDLLMSYSIALPSVQFKLFSDRMLVWQKPRLLSHRSSFLHVLGAGMQVIERESSSGGSHLKIFFTKNYSCRRSCDRCFVIINKRPVRDKQIDKVLRSHISKQDDKKYAGWPVAALIIEVPSMEIDVNVNANKTEVFLTMKSNVLKMLVEMLQEDFQASKAQSESSASKESSSSFNNDQIVDQVGDMSVDQHKNPVDSEDSRRSSDETNCEVDFQQTSGVGCHFQADGSQRNSLFDDVESRTESNDENLDRVVVSESDKCQRSDPASTTHQSSQIEPEIVFAPNFTISSQLSDVGESRDGTEADRCVDDDPDQWSRGHALKDVDRHDVEPVRVIRGQQTLRKDADNGNKSSRKRPSDELSQSTLDGVVEVIQRKKPRSIFDICRDETGKSWEDLCEDDQKKVASVACQEYDKCAGANKDCRVTMSTKKTISRNSFITIGSDDDSDDEDTGEVTKVKLSFNLKRVKKNVMIAGLSFNNCPRVVGFLYQHQAALLCHNSLIYVINLLRLQEAIIFRNLLTSHQLPCIDLDVDLELNEDNLGTQELDVLRTLPVCATSHLQPDVDVVDQRLVSNGFKVKRISGGYHGYHLHSMTTSVPYYALDDLRDILRKISLNKATTLEGSRPSKVIYYLQGEAARVVKSSPSQPDDQDVMRMLNSLSQFESAWPEEMFSTQCFHQRNIFHKLFEIKTLDV
ncbi:PMS1 protein homolog 1-like [Clavelina lepadiformis]|uniref:PMS1 protein homolog 1-like n=1 Tax=Clavelina lepadiformis TaxID=159417 RepID=UPI004042669A